MSFATALTVRSTAAASVARPMASAAAVFLGRMTAASAAAVSVAGGLGTIGTAVAVTA